MGGDRVPGWFDPGGIDQFDGHPIAVAQGGQVVTGGAGAGRDDGLVPAHESVEEPALAGVRRTDQNHARVGFGPIALSEPLLELGQLGCGSIELAGQRRTLEGIDVGLFREIKVSFQVGDQVEQAVAQGEDRP